MQDKRKLAIEVDNVQKIYKLYDKPSDRLKEAFGFGKKTKHKLHYALKGVSMKIYLRSAGAGCRLQYGIQRYRECLSEWYHDGIFRKRDRGKAAGDLKLCGYRRLCLSAGKDLFQRYVRPPGVCSGDQYRAGDPDRR